MKQRVKIWWKALIGGLLSVLGFSGCGSNGISDVIPDFLDRPAEYGMPHANYKLLGDVTDSQGKPIKGIRVIFAPYGDPKQERWENDTLYTDEKGHFEREKIRFEFGWVDDTVTFLAEDIDGEENGSFQSKEVVGKDKITLTQVKEGDDHWDKGDFEISAQITLEENAE